MEVLQMLKFALKQSRLDFTKGWITHISALQVMEPDINKDLLGDLLGLNSEDTFDKIIQDFGKDSGDDELEGNTN